MNGNDSASSCAVRRSRRPQARLETSCTRTGRPRRHLRLNQAAGRRAKAQATRPVCEESHRGIVPMKHSNKDGTLSAESAEGRLRLKENTFPLDTYPTQRGTARVPRVGECADMLCLAAMYPREEPDALTSARPDLCGGRRATGVPTAIVS